MEPGEAQKNSQNALKIKTLSFTKRCDSHWESLILSRSKASRELRFASKRLES